MELREETIRLWIAVFWDTTDVAFYCGTKSRTRLQHACSYQKIINNLFSCFVFTGHRPLRTRAANYFIINQVV